MKCGMATSRSTFEGSFDQHVSHFTERRFESYKAMKCEENGAHGAPTMSTDIPDKARVVASPPLIVAVILALGLLVHFFWPVSFVDRTNAFWLGAPLIVVSIPIVTGAAWQLAKAKTAFDVCKPTTEIVTGGVFGISRILLIFP